MLELRPNCENCDCDLSAEEPAAYICSFECTFCTSCSEQVFHKTCPNCGGSLHPRPTRSADLLKKFPASTKRVNKNVE